MTRRVAAFVLTVLALAGGRAAAATITVPAGGNLQTALNNAQPGDTILLAAGATYTGNFVLPAKNGTAFITIRSNAADSSLPAAGTRITPSYAAYLPKLKSATGSMPALSTAASASYYQIQFVEFLPNPAGTGAMIELGKADSTQNTLAVVPHDLVIDRCYLHASPGVAQLRGIALNSGKTTIRDSYISEIKYAGQDSQAIAGWNGPGPFTILNNYLEAAGENILIGGSTMEIPNTTPTGIVFRNNYCTKQVSWRNSSWTIKNIFELKHAQDVTVDGNVFENLWLAAQPGYAIVFTPRNQYADNPWTVVQRVTFTNNIVRHVSSVFNILGYDNNATSKQTNHITIRNNVFEDVSGTNWGGVGRLMLISMAADVAVDHNTGFNSGNQIYAYGGLSPRFVFTNNIANATSYGIMGDATGEGTGTISTYFTDGTFQENLFVATTKSSLYPGMSFFPASMSAVGFVNLSGGDYHLASTSPYKGKATGGKDPGADIDALKAAQAGGGTTTTPPPSTDAAPSVALTAPATGGSYAAPASMTLSATASDGDSTGVARVEFYANGTLVGTAASSPYSCTWTNVAAGSYSLTAVAIDTANLRTTSGTVSVTVASSTGTGGGTTGTAVPSPWTDGDVGSVGLAGSASYSNGTFTVKGAGADIWGTADAFNYVSRPQSGDGQMVARVASLQNTNAYAKAGLMMRDGLGSNAANVLVDVKPGGGVEMLVRSSAGGSTTYVAGNSTAAPVWLKLVRAGNTFTASSSANGSTWTTVGQATVTMAANVYAGLAVCSHTTAQLASAAFDNVSVGTASTTTTSTSAPEIVIYANDVASGALHGSWSKVSDGTAAASMKASTPDAGWSTTSTPLAQPADYVDVTFNAQAGQAYTLWLRLQGTANSKYNESVWVQFSDAQVNGAAAYPLNSTSGLLVNLENCSGCGVSGWGWQNTAYWLSQATTVTFSTSGTHTMRIQVREDGVQIDQIVLSPAKYRTTAPGALKNDTTIVAK